MAHFTALYDACVLYPAPLRDLLMQLALTDMFRAKWTDDIHREWTRNVLKDRPDLKKENLDKVCQLMNSHVRDCLVSEYSDLIPALTLPDKDDRHVLAAAIKGKADVIVTFNLKDFPRKALHQYAIESQHPDEFCTHLLDLEPGRFCEAVKIHRGRLRNPPKSVEEYLQTLGSQGLPLLVQHLQEYKDLL